MITKIIKVIKSLCQLVGDFVIVFGILSIVYWVTVRLGFMLVFGVSSIWKNHFISLKDEILNFSIYSLILLSLVISALVMYRKLKYDRYINNAGSVKYNKSVKNMIRTSKYYIFIYIGLGILFYQIENEIWFRNFIAGLMFMHAVIAILFTFYMKKTTLEERKGHFKAKKYYIPVCIIILFSLLFLNISYANAVVMKTNMIKRVKLNASFVNKTINIETGNPLRKL